MLRTGSYTIRDIKKFFHGKFVIGDVIETTLKHPDGTYHKLGFEIVDMGKDGAECRVLYEHTNEGGQSMFHINATTFIHKNHFKHFYIP